MGRACYIRAPPADLSRGVAYRMSRADAELFTLDETAARLHVSRRWLQDFLRGRPYGRMAGRKRLFTESDIAALIEELPCPSISSRPGKANRPTGRSGARTSGSALTALRERLTKDSRGESSPKSAMKSNVAPFPNRARQLSPRQP